MIKKTTLTIVIMTVTLFGGNISANASQCLTQKEINKKYYICRGGHNNFKRGDKESMKKCSKEMRKPENKKCSDEMDEPKNKAS